MAKPYVKTNVEFGLSPTDAVVKAWLEENGISPEAVMAYRITRGSKNVLPTIELTMFYSEERAVTGNGIPS